MDESKEISWKRCHKDARMFKLNIQHDASEKVTVFFMLNLRVVCILLPNLCCRMFSRITPKSIELPKKCPENSPNNTHDT